MNLLTLYAELALDASGFERGVQKASKQGATLAASLRGGLGNASQVVINNMSAASVAVGNLLADVARATVNTGKQLVQTGIDYNTQMETYQTNFTTMLDGSREAAQGLTADLQEMAAATPFAMTDLADATQTLLSFGQDSETVLDTLQSLGDIAMGDKNKLSSLTLAFAQASSAGKLMGQDLMQMINAGFNPLLTISERTGASMGDLKEFMSTGKMTNDLRKSMYAARVEVAKLGDEASDGAKMLVQMYEDGAISAELLGQIFDIETSPGGRFYNAMENASKTISGLSATLGDDFTALTGKVLTPVTDWLRDKLLPGAIEAVGRLDKAFDVGGLAGLASEATKIVSDTFATWGPIALNAGAGLIANVLTGLKGDTVSADEVKATLSGIWTAGTTGIDNIWTAATTFWTDLNTKLGEDTTVGAKIAGVFGAFNTAKADVLTSVSTLFTSIYSELTGDDEGADKVNSALSGLFSGWNEAKNSMLAAAGTLFDTVYESLTGQEATAENVKATIGGLFSAGVDTATEVLDVASTFFTDLSEALGEDTGIGDKISGVFNVGLNAADGLVDASGTLLSRMYEAITGDEEGARNLKNFIGGLFPNEEQREAIWNMLFPSFDAEESQHNQEQFLEAFDIGGGDTTSTQSIDAQRAEARNIVSSMYAGGEITESQLDNYFATLAGPVNDAFREVLDEIYALRDQGVSPESNAEKWNPSSENGEGDSSEIVAALNANTAAVESIPGAVASAISGAKVEMDGHEVGQIILEEVSLGIIRGGRLERKTGYEGGTP